MRGIFVGSPGEQRSYARRIVQSLRKNKFEAWGWWEKGVFPPGHYTLSRLIELSGLFDGAVFLFRGKDRTWYKKKLTRSPRDNVVLEYGLFAGKLGIKNTVIVKDAKVRLPRATMASRTNPSDAHAKT